MKELLYKREMDQIFNLVFQVRNRLGSGWSEEIYHQALAHVAQEQGIPTQSKPRESLIHRGVEIHTFEADLIFWNKIIIELKVLWEYQGRNFHKVNQAQLLQYLKFYRMSVGALVNLAHPKVGIQRMAFVPKPVRIEQEYERMLSSVTESEKQILREVQRHIVQIAHQYGFGYPETVYRQLIAVELRHHGIPCVSEPDIPAQLDKHQLGTHTIPHLLVANRFLLYVRSNLKHIPSHNFLRTQTYLNALNLQVGWVVNFGRNALQIHATATQ